MKQGANKKRGTFATKIIVMVILAVIVSNVICMVFILESSKKQITDSVKHTMVDVINTTSKIMENEISNSGVDDLDYDGYANNLSDVKLEGMDSAYMYVVQNDGTMLYHPTKEKVGQPVENAVIKGVVQQLQDGKKPGTAVVEYDFNGTTKYSAYTILNNENILVLTADESEALAGITTVTGVAVGISAIVVLLAIIICFILGRRLMRPLVKVSTIIEEIANGDINADFGMVKETNDEIGLIIEKMKELTQSLGNIVGKIRNSSDTMSANSYELNDTSSQTLAANNEISKAVEDVAEGSTGMAASISKINENLLEMSNETKDINESVNEIRNQTTAVQDSSKIMNDKIKSMQDSSHKMDEGISAISKRIETVNTTVDKVSNIVSVIEEISSETNLLSLNASIEAARAGDAGKGFAVVAQEIRVLSDNTNTELENIKQIISSLVEECRYCVQASGTIVEDNAKQKEEIKAVLDEFGSLDEQIQKTAEKADEIEELVTAMIELNDDITKSSNSLTDVSAANAAATEEMNANIEELNAMMHGVSEMAEHMNNESDGLKEALSFFNN
ncbi:methyl-accepting chemotaxis protein [Agathobacter rectalis]|jgi:methyl-accepting chemotaxis protein|uniref:Methyl-accepting chemotaxis protein n=1 Tax=Agathobacter rectalis TaxID=39491 RepID=A0A414ISE0_9FIRM|nr:methyl-accepting chemotaxis protein [Agathobacter rectalis]RGT09701.1 methyl-accepting chemotaxis protein [Agathobacter rectalis]RGT17476.1 methyl-accepting chemotaxis protein [Agathobacter rectalis]RHD89907.1 methyl-accepting chemotaxis protein [Agathobacter rectalis]RHE31390.1 methyl-accepting chemotaxis protein [Agathobacter rectalis]